MSTVARQPEPITREGYERLRAELDRLVTVHRRRMEEDLREARADGTGFDDHQGVAAVLDDRGLDAALSGQVVRLPQPSMASEDFAYVLEEVPGVLVFLGVRPEDTPETSAPGMHSEGAVFDDGRLDAHAVALAELAWRRLTR